VAERREFGRSFGRTGANSDVPSASKAWPNEVANPLWLNCF